MGFFYIFGILLVIATIRAVSFGVWNIKNHCIAGGVALFILAALTALSGFIFVLA